ncbi:MAG: ATP-binding protein [Planctomycetaceae bacterium]|nr:ATP-binding protein [Planctomycetaceae bacterium]
MNPSGREIMAETEFAISISSNTSEGHEVQQRILSTLESLHYSSKDLFGVKLALEEAIVNAIKHGNGLDPDKQVHIHCEADRHSLKVTIEDEGEGFDPEDVPDPTDDENLEKPSGRGVMLMRAFMTSVEYNDRGNRVRLVKERSEPDDE